jgi:hypothetical protein
MSYNKIYELIRDKEDKRLVSGDYWSKYEKCACVLGTIPALKGFITENDPYDGSFIRGIYRSFCKNSEQLFYKGEDILFGMTIAEAEELQEYNDSCLCNQKDILCVNATQLRYIRVLEWLKERVLEEDQQQ